MAIDETCIFCKLAHHEIPTQVVYEDDSVFAFEDAEPQAPVHVLVVPKDHYQDASDDVPDELMAKLMKAANKVAQIKGVDKSGYRILTNKGSDAGQTVFHLHIHVLGGTESKSRLF
ncbi:MAG: histidine triad nucleotide-binding protein [Coriobacteriia bacterium]|nr:histidine triad nucleotide-binding protein [Coriobacteriia bacterium]